MLANTALSGPLGIALLGDGLSLYFANGFHYDQNVFAEPNPTLPRTAHILKTLTREESYWTDEIIGEWRDHALLGFFLDNTHPG
jgi:hypothetical protein